MDKLLEEFDGLVETLGIDISENHAEIIKNYRDNLTTVSNEHNELLENNISLLEVNEELKTSVKEQKQKYYNKFMTGGAKENNEKDTEVKEATPISDLINLI